MILAGFPLQQTYLRDRYVGSPGSECRHSPLVPAREQHPDRCYRRVFVFAVSVLRNNLSNYVQYLGIAVLTEPIPTFSSCQAWRETIDSGRYSYKLIATNVVSTRSGHPRRRSGDEMDGTRQGFEGRPRGPDPHRSAVRRVLRLHPVQGGARTSPPTVADVTARIRPAVNGTGRSRPPDSHRPRWREVSDLALVRESRSEA